MDEIVAVKDVFVECHGSPSPALRNVDLDIARDRTLGLVGPNGAIMSALPEVQKDPAGQSQSGRDIGYVIAEDACIIARSILLRVGVVAHGSVVGVISLIPHPCRRSRVSAGEGVP